MDHAIRCDVHTHTMFSRHAYSTIGECVAAAQTMGLELLGSTDHYSVMLTAVKPTAPEYLREFQHFINFGVWPREWDGVTVLRGVEADIVDLKGNLFGWNIMLREGITGRMFEEAHSLKSHVWRNIDYAIASIHDATFAERANVARTTDMYVHVLEDPKVLMLGHLGRNGVPFDVDEVLLAAKGLGKLIEINEHSFAPQFAACHDRCRRLAERCAELGVMISTGSDAHIAHDVGRFDFVLSMLEEIDFPQELVATRSKKEFLGVLGKSQHLRGA